MTTATHTVAASTNDVAIKNYKKQIEALRKNLSDPAVVRNPEKTQQIYDQIEDTKRRIEELTKGTRRAVPVKNAPIVGERRVSRRKTHFSI